MKITILFLAAALGSSATPMQIGNSIQTRGNKQNSCRCDKPIIYKLQFDEDPCPIDYDYILAYHPNTTTIAYAYCQQHDCSSDQFLYTPGQECYDTFPFGERPKAVKEASSCDCGWPVQISLRPGKSECPRGWQLASTGSADCIQTCCEESDYNAGCIVESNNTLPAALTEQQGCDCRQTRTFAKPTKSYRCPPGFGETNDGHACTQGDCGESDYHGKCSHLNHVEP
ncbi:hypothetical protein IF2G_04096 [Cordyceps javanica]|nr:hypothetical protein IF2G_04096 [Cordyceps javanica]